MNQLFSLDLEDISRVAAEGHRKRGLQQPLTPDSYVGAPDSPVWTRASSFSLGSTSQGRRP